MARRVEDMSKKPMGIPSGAIEFNFFMPDFSVYTPENYDKEFHPDHVYVLVEAVGKGEELTDAPGRYPPNMFNRVTSYEGGMDLESLQIQYGIECYLYKNFDPAQGEMRYCFGISDEVTKRHIYFQVRRPPHPDWVKFPQMQAYYFSPEYGGVHILWRTHVQNFPRWKEIDQQIWYWLDEWNIAKPTLNAPSSTKP